MTHLNKITPPPNNTAPTKIKTSDLPSNTFLNFYPPPQLEPEGRVHAVCIRESMTLLFLEYNLWLFMSSSWFIVSPVRNSYPGLAVLSMCVRGMSAITNSNHDSASSWKTPLCIGTSQSVSAPQVSSTLQDIIIFPKKFTQFLLYPPYLSSLSPRNWEACHKLSDNQYVPSLSSSFVLLPEGASYLCVTGSQHPLNSFCILSGLAVISLYSLGKHRFNQQLPLSTVSMSRGDM